MQQKIDFIIPVLLSKAPNLAPLIHSICNQNTKFIATATITLVVNPANEQDVAQLSEQIKEYALGENQFRVHVIGCKETGVNSARQLGLDQTSGSLVFFFDDDVILTDTNLIDIHMSYHLENPELFAVGGYYAAAQKPSLFGQIYLNRQIQWLNESYTDVTKTKSNYLIGGHFSIKRSLLETYNLGFDPQIKFGSSETDFFLMARRKGLDLLLIKNSVNHAVKDSPMSLLIKAYRQGAGKRYIENKGLVFSPLFRSISQPKNRIETLIHSLFQISFSWGYFSFDRNYAGFFNFYMNQIFLHLKYQKQKWINYLRNDF